jgi:hypothetical protein
MKKFLTRAAGKAVVLITAAALCLAACPSPVSGNGNSEQDAANAFKTAHAGVLAKTAGTVTIADKVDVEAALAAYEALGAGVKALLVTEKTLLDSLKLKIDASGNTAQDAANAFKADRTGVLNKTTDNITTADKDAVEAALVAYDVLDADAKALLAGEKALLDSLKAKIAGLAATAEQKAAADAFKTGNSVLEKTADTVTAADKGAVDAALAAYEALGETEKALLAPEKTLLDSLKARVDALAAAQEAADVFKTAHAAVLAKTADNIATGDEAAVNAALVDYDALDAGAKALLVTEKTLLDSLKAEIAGLATTEAQKAAAEAFKTGNSVLEKTADTVTAADKGAVDTALAAYEALDETEKALLAPEKALLDSLKAKIDALAAAQEAADSFKTAHAAVLGKTADNITVADEAAVTVALAACDALSADAKTLLVTEKTLLDSLKTKIEQLKGQGTGGNAAQEAATAFKAAHTVALGKTTATVTTADEAVVTAALAAYNSLGTDVKALLTTEKTLLDSLKTKIDQLKNQGTGDPEQTPQQVANAFKTTHTGALGKTTATVTAADEAAVNAALGAYNALDAGAKALLVTEKTLLDSLKTKIEQLKGQGTGGNAAQEAANAFKTAHSGALGKTTATVTTADEVAVTAALDAYNALDAGAKALLVTEKTLLDSLKAKIDQLKNQGTGGNAAQEAAAAFKTAHSGALGKTTATVTTADESAVTAALDAYNALDAGAKALLVTEKTLLDSLKAKIDAMIAVQTAANAFKTTHAAVLAKTTANVTAADEAAVTAALDAYNALGADAKVLLVTEKTLLDSLKAKIDQLLSGTGRFPLVTWANEDESLLSDIRVNEEEISVSDALLDGIIIYRSDRDTLAIEAADSLENIRWSLNGTDIPAPRGTSRKITIEAASYKEGRYTLGLYAELAGVPCSINITFVVD